MSQSATTHPQSDEVRYPLVYARELAEILMEHLRPFCERIEVAGSIRRKKTTVKDIELLYIPKLGQECNMFGEPERIYSELKEEADRLVEAGAFSKRLNKNGHVASWGNQNLFATVYPARLGIDCEMESVPLDLFGVLDPECWGVQMMIRTGPANYTHGMVTPREMGGQILKSGMKIEGGALWLHGRLIPCPEESDFYAAIGRHYPDPEVRF